LNDLLLYGVPEVVATIHVLGKANYLQDASRYLDIDLAVSQLPGSRSERGTGVAPFELLQVMFEDSSPSHGHPVPAFKTPAALG